MYNNLVGSPHSSISNDDLGSDPGDPIHSESILNELFYKQVVRTNISTRYSGYREANHMSTYGIFFIAKE